MEEKLKSLKAECDRLWNVVVEAQQQHRPSREVGYLENKYFKVLNKYNKEMLKCFEKKMLKAVEG